VRVRTMLTLSTGAALGAGAMYLLDPEHGPDRRREARRTAARSAREGAVRAAADARQRAEALTVAAVAGYRQARTEQDVTDAV
jgi:hypothetical protein